MIKRNTGEGDKRRERENEERENMMGRQKGEKENEVRGKEAKRRHESATYNCYEY